MIINALRLAIAIGLILYLFVTIDVSVALEQAAEGHWGYVLIGTIVLAFQPFVGAARWNVILRNNRSAVALSTATRWNYISVFFGQVLPATVGADALKIWYATRRAVSLKNAVTSVALDRIAMLTTLLALLCFGAPLMERYLSGAWLALFVAGLGGGLGAGVGLLVFGDMLPEHVYRFKVLRGLAHLARDAKAFLFNPKAALEVLLLCLLSYGILMLSIYFFSLGFGAVLQPIDVLVLAPPVLAASMLPLSIGGWGTREVAMVAALGTAGVTSEAALLTSVWLGLGSILIALPGGLFFLSDGESLKSLSLGRRASSTLKETST